MDKTWEEITESCIQFNVENPYIILDTKEDFLLPAQIAGYLKQENKLY